VAGILAVPGTRWSTAGLLDAALDVGGAWAVTCYSEATARGGGHAGARAIGSRAGSATEKVRWDSRRHGEKSKDYCGEMHNVLMRLIRCWKLSLERLHLRRGQTVLFIF
jgi:hypothetical protein